MDHFRSIKTFIKVAECEGFAAAARELAMSPPAVTRAVAQLEDQLGTRLFIRTTRSVRLTKSGVNFYQDSKRILQELLEAEAAAAGTHARPQGNLCITAPAVFGRIYVSPIIGEYVDKYPLVSCHGMFVDRVVNLMDEAVDVAIRIGDLPDSSLSATRVGSVRRVFFASPDYIQKNGVPSHPTELADHKLIKSMALGAANEWPYREDGKIKSIKVNSQIKMNTNDAVIELALKGWGISNLLSYQIAPYLTDNKLKTILKAFELPAVPVHVIHQEGRIVSTRVRSFVDFLVKQLRANPDLN